MGLVDPARVASFLLPGQPSRRDAKAQRCRQEVSVLSCWFDRRRTRIAGDLNITIAQENLKPLQLQRIFDRLYARASNRRWRILATDNYWRNEKCKLV